MKIKDSWYAAQCLGGIFFGEVDLDRAAIPEKKDLVRGPGGCYGFLMQLPRSACQAWAMASPCSVVRVASRVRTRHVDEYGSLALMTSRAMSASSGRISA